MLSRCTALPGANKPATPPGRVENVGRQRSGNGRAEDERNE